MLICALQRFHRLTVCGWDALKATPLSWSVSSQFLFRWKEHWQTPTAQTSDDEVGVEAVYGQRHKFQRVVVKWFLKFWKNTKVLLQTSWMYGQVYGWLSTVMTPFTYPLWKIPSQIASPWTHGYFSIDCRQG